MLCQGAAAARDMTYNVVHRLSPSFLYSSVRRCLVHCNTVYFGTRSASFGFAPSRIFTRLTRVLSSAVTTLDMESADVVVVGAGAAGLYAGHLFSLQHPSKKLVVVEAQQRLGGRIMQDLGADFVHGTIANPIASIAKEKVSVVYISPSPLLIYCRDGSFTTYLMLRRVEETNSLF